MTRYAIVVEKAGGNYSAYVPDLPGCVATGETVEATEKRLWDVIEFHVQGMKADDLPVPEPLSVVDYLEVSA